MVFLFLLVSVALNGVVEFPASPCEAASPDAHYAVVCDLETPDDGELQLLLQDCRTHTERRLETFHRSVDVLWFPDSRNVAVTSWASSNASWVHVYASSGQQCARDPQDDVQKAFGPPPEVADNDHVYFEDPACHTSKVLVMRMSGHGDHDPDGFYMCFDVDLEGQTKRSRACPYTSR